MREADVEGIDDSGEDGVDTLLLEIGVSDDVEVSLETTSDNCSSSTWWTHGSDEIDILNSIEWLLLRNSVIPSLMIHELSQ